MTKKLLISEGCCSQFIYPRSLLESQQYDVSKANSLDEDKMILRNEKNELVLGDTLSENSNGRVFCRQIKANHEPGKMTKLLLSSLVVESDLRCGLEFGVDGFIAKPYSDYKLWSSIEQVLNQKNFLSGNASKGKIDFKNEGQVCQFNVCDSQVDRLLLSACKNTNDKNNKLISANLYTFDH